MAPLLVTGSSLTIPGTFPNEDRAENLSSVSFGPVIAIVMFCHRGVATCRRDMRRHLRCKENFACVRIFYWGSRRKTDDLYITRFWRERTGN
jgi:hypothetical protein